LPLALLSLSALVTTAAPSFLLYHATPRSLVSTFAGSKKHPVDYVHIGHNCNLPVIKYSLQRFFSRHLDDVTRDIHELGVGLRKQARDTHRRFFDGPDLDHRNQPIHSSEIDPAIYWKAGCKNPATRALPRLLSHEKPFDAMRVDRIASQSHNGANIPSGFRRQPKTDEKGCISSIRAGHFLSDDAWINGMQLRLVNAFTSRGFTPPAMARDGADPQRCPYTFNPRNSAAVGGRLKEREW